MAIIKEPTWRKVFKVVIQNAFEKLNLIFRSWQLNILSDDFDAVVKSYISNNAISLLNETTVTQYIFAEFIGSSLTNGAFFDGANRHYQIFREQEFKWTKDGLKKLKDSTSITKKTLLLRSINFTRHCEPPGKICA